MTLRKRVLLACLFGTVFFISLCIFAPASLMGYVLERASGGKLALAQTTGSLWQGAGIAILQQKNRQQLLGSYHWSVHLFSLSVQVQTGDSTPMTLRYMPLSGHLDIAHPHLSLPASALEIAAPQLGPYQLQGTLEIRSDHLLLDAAGMNGQITVDWLRAASGLSEIKPLGDYRILLHGNGAVLNGELSTLSGKLQLAGEGSFDKASGMRINGTAQAAPGAAADELNELLHHIGPEMSPGVYTLALMPQPSVNR